MTTQTREDAYSFYARKVRSSVQVREQRFLAQSGTQDPAIAAERYATAGVDGLDDSRGLECGLDVCFVCHLAGSPAPGQYQAVSTGSVLRGG